jgi:hypothetical protein
MWILAMDDSGCLWLVVLRGYQPLSFQLGEEIQISMVPYAMVVVEEFRPGIGEILIYSKRYLKMVCGARVGVSHFLTGLLSGYLPIHWVNRIDFSSWPADRNSSHGFDF